MSKFLIVRVVALLCWLTISTLNIIALPIAAQSTDDDWPMVNMDYATTRYNRAETIISPENVANLVEIWRIDNLGGVTGTPAVMDGVVYFGDWHGWLHAVDAETGAIIWQTQTTEDRLTASAMVTDSTVYIPDLDGMLFAHDRATGDKLWEVELDADRQAAAFSSPVVVDDILVIGIAKLNSSEIFRGSIVGLNATTGEEIWRVYTDAGDTNFGSGSVWSSGAVDVERKLVYIGSGNPEVRPGSPYTDALLAINYETGDVAWVHQFTIEDIYLDLDVGGSPNLFTIDGRDVVGVGSKAGIYKVFDRETGEEIWTTELTTGSPSGGVMVTAAVGDDVIYVVSNIPFVSSVSFALDSRDGSILWQQPLNQPAFGAVTVANGVVYHGTTPIVFGNQGAYYALDASDGTVLWNVEPGGLVGGGLSIIDGKLFAGYGTGMVPLLRPARNGGIIAYSLPDDGG